MVTRHKGRRPSKKLIVQIGIEVTDWSKCCVVYFVMGDLPILIVSFHKPFATYHRFHDFHNFHL